MSSTAFASKPLQVSAAVIGNALERYDFIVFGFFAVIIARLAPAFYVMFGAAAGLLASLFLKERARDRDLTVTDVEVALN